MCSRVVFVLKQLKDFERRDPRASVTELRCHMFHCCSCPEQSQGLHSSAMSSSVIFRN